MNLDEILDSLSLSLGAIFKVRPCSDEMKRDKEGRGKDKKKVGRTVQQLVIALLLEINRPNINACVITNLPILVYSSENISFLRN